MRVTMIRCDNPACTQLGGPEWVDPKGKKGHTGPYGWIQAQVTFVGTGPFLEVDACCTECLTPAVSSVWKRHRDEEEEKYS